MKIEPDSGWGGGGSCPADLQTTVLGQPVAFSFSLVCTFAQSLRPLVIGFAWLSAVLIALGIYKRAGA